MFLRSKDEHPAAGATATLAQMWPLSQRWYGDRLEPTFSGRSVEEAQEMLTEVGLTSAFWQLT